MSLVVAQTITYKNQMLKPTPANFPFNFGLFSLDDLFHVLSTFTRALFSDFQIYLFHYFFLLPSIIFYSTFSLVFQVIFPTHIHSHI